MLRVLLALILASSVITDAAAQQTPRGVWLLPRKGPQNTARADLPATMLTAPHEVWRFGGNPNNFSALFPLTLDGADLYLVHVYGALWLLRPDGALLWNQSKLGVTQVVAVDDFGHPSQLTALVILGTTDLALIDLRDGHLIWTWTAPEGSNLSSSASWKIWQHAGQSRFIVFPQNSLRGFAIDLSQRTPVPKVLWDQTYTNAYWKAFGPQIVLADMDRDGVPDVVLAGKPGYVAVIDALTGAIKFDLHYTVTGGPEDIGRPYGFMIATDLDGDGFPDIVMVSCQVEEYLSIIHNESGKSLRPVWSRFIAMSFPQDEQELRPNLTSVTDLRGDGRKELVLGLYNTSGDHRWHTVIIDPMKGFDARLADWPDQYFWGCYDLAADAHPQVITSTETTRKPAASSTLHAFDGRTFTEAARVPDAALATDDSGPLPPDRGFMAIRQTPRIYRSPTTGDVGLILSRRQGKTAMCLWSSTAHGSRFTDFPITPLAALVARSTATTRPASLDLVMPKLRGPSVAASAPLIVRSHDQPQLVLQLSDGTTVMGSPRLDRPDALAAARSFRGSMPAAWQSLAGDLTLITVQSDDSLAIHHPDHPDTPPTIIPLPHALYRNSTSRSAPTLLPFGDREMNLFVGLQIGVHTVACAMYDATGHQRWTDDHEGPYPRSAAAARLGPGPDYSLIVDNHGKHLIYDALTGKSKLIAHGWFSTVPGRSDGAKYTVPIVGPFGADGQTRIPMSSGLQAVETLDTAGNRLAKWDTASTYQFEWNGAAVGRLRGDRAGWDLLMVSRDGILHCLDALTSHPRWTMDLHCKATAPINLVTADLTGNGRDDVLAPLPNGTLLAITDSDGRPAELWSTELDTGLREAIVGDVLGSGQSQIIVETLDGSIRLLK